MKPERRPIILIVEDSVLNHDLYRDVFTEYGFDVVIREDADGSFLDEVSALRPDIISMDLMMGRDGAATERDGFDALSALKGDLRTHEIPVIILTSFFEESKVRKARELGAVDFLSIPGQTMSKLPEHYLRYLKDPEHYQPVHQLFRAPDGPNEKDNDGRVHL